MIPNKFLEFNNPDYNSIPNIPLYMDQLLEYLSTHLSPLTRFDNDSVFTKTMINNYVKSNVIDAPVKKKYTKSSIADLVLVYHLKQCFSIQDTSDILDTIKNNTDDYYTTFIEKHHDTLCKSISENQDLKDRNTLVYQMMSLAIEASIKKQLAEQLLDQLKSESNEIIEKKPIADKGSK